MADSVFTQIINGELPANIRYQDDDFIAFDDIHPVAKVHVLIVPKKPWTTLEEVADTDLEFHGKLLLTVRKVAKLLHVNQNYKVVMNIGAQIQAVPHIHVHLIADDLV